MLLKGISRLLSVTLAGSMQVLFNAPSAFVLRRLRLVLHPAQIHQPRYFHCVSTSQVCQKRGRPEHPTPLPCIAINRVFPRKVGLYAHLACGTKLAKHAVIGAPSSKAFVRRPLLPCPVPFMICGQPIFRESPPSSPSPFIPCKRMANQRGEIAHIFLPTTKSTTTPFARWAPTGTGAERSVAMSPLDDLRL